MDVIVPNRIDALNGTTVIIPCTFTSCYKMDLTKFAMNWTYQETTNDTEEMVTWLVLTSVSSLNSHLQSLRINASSKHSLSFYSS